MGHDEGGVRLAELVATLSYAADLGLGQPMEPCLRQTVIALRLADLADADPADRESTYYLGMMVNSYCHADASEQARWFGDDISFKGDGFEVLTMSTPQVAAMLLRKLASHGSAADRVRRLATFPRSGQREIEIWLTTHTKLGSEFAERIGLGDGCRRGRRAKPLPEPSRAGRTTAGQRIGSRLERRHLLGVTATGRPPQPGAPGPARMRSPRSHPC